MFDFLRGVLGRCRSWKRGRGTCSLAANASYLGAATLFSQAVRAIYMLALARALGPELYGLLVYGLSWYVTFLPLAAFGIGSIISRELGQKGSTAGPLLETSLAFRLLSVTVAAFVCLGVGWSGAHDPLQRMLLLAFCSALVGRGIALWSQHVFVGFERARLSLLQDGIFRPLEALVGLGLVLSDAGVVSIAMLHAAVWWLQAAHGIRLVRTKLQLVVPRWEPERLLGLAVSGAPVALGGVLAGWLITGPLILYTQEESATAHLVGQVALPMQLCTVLFGFMMSASTAAVPILSRSASRGDRRYLQFLWWISGGAVLVGGAGYLFGALFGPRLVQTVFGYGFEVAGQLLGPALALLVPLIVGNAAYQVLIVRGLTFHLIVSAALGAITLSIALPWLVPRFGASGAILAAGIGSIVWAVVSLAFTQSAGPPSFMKGLSSDRRAGA